MDLINLGLNEEHMTWVGNVDRATIYLISIILFIPILIHVYTIWIVSVDIGFD